MSFSQSPPSFRLMTQAASHTIATCGTSQTCWRSSQVSRSPSGSAPVLRRLRCRWCGAQAASWPHHSWPPPPGTSRKAIARRCMAADLSPRFPTHDCITESAAAWASMSKARCCALAAHGHSRRSIATKWSCAPNMVLASCWSLRGPGRHAEFPCAFSVRLGIPRLSVLSACREGLYVINPIQ
jgi:hypothetical protein